MKYVIGIDSGGTKFLIKAADLKGNIIGSYVGKPANINRIGKQLMAERIRENISRFMEIYSLSKSDCQAFVCGTTGVDSDESRREIEAVYKESIGNSYPVLCINDAEIALYAAAKGCGVIVIAGTGSVAFGRDRSGKMWRCGGWPLCIFGDEGSGTWMNQKALEHVSHVIDGRVKKSILYQKLIEELRKSGMKMETAGDLISVCQRIEEEGSGFLNLAPVVIAAAKEGDRYAENLISEEAECTFALAEGVLKNLDFHGETMVGVWGSAIVKNSFHYDGFTALMRQHYPNAKVCIPEKDAADGACALALDILNGKAVSYHFE